MHSHKVLSFAATFAFSMLAHAHDYNLGNLHVMHPYARATVQQQQNGAAYIGIQNNGKETDKLIAVSSPAAKKTELHTMSMENNVMKMREITSIEIAPGAKVTMQPGDGSHIMLIGLKKQLKANDQFPLTLTFEKAGKIDVSVRVEDRNTDAGSNIKPHVHPNQRP